MKPDRLASFHRSSGEREPWLAAMPHDPLLPGRILPSDYLEQQAWCGARRSRRFNVGRRASLGLFLNLSKPGR